MRWSRSNKCWAREAGNGTRSTKPRRRYVSIAVCGRGGGFDRESVRGSGAVSWEVELEEDVVGGRCLCDGAE